jgi:hypothetical protein
MIFLPMDAGKGPLRLRKGPCRKRSLKFFLKKPPSARTKFLKKFSLLW